MDENSLTYIVMTVVLMTYIVLIAGLIGIANIGLLVCAIIQLIPLSVMIGSVVGTSKVRG